MSIRTAARRWLERRLHSRGYHLIPEWAIAKFPQRTHTADLLQALDIDCVFDVGANIGQYYRFLRRSVGFTGQIVSFEPVDEMYRTLLAAARDDPAWHVHKLALGERNSSMMINVMRERTLSSLLPRDEAGLRTMGYQKYLRETEVSATEEVDVRRLDDVLGELLPPGTRRVFLKCDTQGYDMNVIHGAQQSLRSTVVAVQIELSVRQVYRGSTHYLEALAALEAMDYELTGVFPVQRDSALRVVNLDCVLVQRAAAERLREARAAAGGN